MTNTNPAAPAPLLCNLGFTLMGVFFFFWNCAGMLKQMPRACCGASGVGEYNFNLTSKCGEPGAYACQDPSNHWSWDGAHLTEAAYGHIAKGWLYGPFADPPILHP